MKYSLFIGRYQPLHKGHIKLIRKVLDEGKNVCIAIKDTPKDKNNPYTIVERFEMFRSAFPKESTPLYKPDDEEYETHWQGGRRILMLAIPDIDEVCYGRKVGWGIREIRLDKEMEAISATEIRKKIKKETGEGRKVK